MHPDCAHDVHLCRLSTCVVRMQHHPAAHAGLEVFHDNLLHPQVKLLRHLQHENVIGLRDIMRPADCEIADFADIYLVYELMDTDLHQIIRSAQPLSDQHLQYFIYQVSCCVCSMYWTTQQHCSCGWSALPEPMEWTRAEALLRQ